MEERDKWASDDANEVREYYRMVLELTTSTYKGLQDRYEKSQEEIAELIAENEKLRDRLAVANEPPERGFAEDSLGED